MAADLSGARRACLYPGGEQCNGQLARGGGEGVVRARTRDCGVGPRAENKPKDCGKSGGGDRGLWMRSAGPGLREDRGLSGPWTCQDEQAQVLGVNY